MSNNMTKDVHKYLSAYFADLEYQFNAEGFSYMNSCSCGTPEFLDTAQAKAYLYRVSTLIKKLEMSQ